MLSSELILSTWQETFNGTSSATAALPFFLSHFHSNKSVSVPQHSIYRKYLLFMHTIWSLYRSAVFLLVTKLSESGGIRPWLNYWIIWKKKKKEWSLDSWSLLYICVTCNLESLLFKLFLTILHLKKGEINGDVQWLRILHGAMTLLMTDSKDKTHPVLKRSPGNWSEKRAGILSPQHG